MWILAFLLFSSAAFGAGEGFLAEALLARVGREAVTLSDLMRFQDVEELMGCAGLRPKLGKKEAFGAVLGRYLEEELIYSEASTKKNAGPRIISNAISGIHSNAKCQNAWRELGKRYANVWGTRSRPLEGEGMLVRELEKRLQIDQYTKTQIQGDRGSWLREAKVKIPVKLYLE